MRRWIVGLLVVGLFGCEAATEEEPVVADEFAEAVPDADMLALRIDDGDVQGLSSPSDYRRLAEGVMDGINNIVSGTQAGVEEIAANVTPFEFQHDGADCRAYVFPWEGVEWQLAVCEKDRVAKKYGFVYRGRPEGSTDEADFRVIFAGYGTALPRVGLEKRGHGVIGYDFDNLNALTNGAANVQGKMAIGYRVVGRGRHLIVGLDNVQGEDDPQPMTALFRFAEIRGVGGRFGFLTPADFLTKDASDEIVEGQDGLTEFLASGIAWGRNLGVRAVSLVCGGTVGEHCVRVAQCFAGDETVWATIELDPSRRPQWGEQCARVPFEPEEGSEEVPPADPETGAPGLQEPEPLPGE